MIIFTISFFDQQAHALGTLIFKTRRKRFTVFTVEKKTFHKKCKFNRNVSRKLTLCCYTAVFENSLFKDCAQPNREHENFEAALKTLNLGGCQRFQRQMCGKH